MGLAAVRLILGIAALAVLIVGCNSPTASDSRVPPAVGTPTNLTLELCSFGPQSTSCRVQARWGELYATYLDVTTVAVWSTNAPAVVQVAGPGTLVASEPGVAQVTVAYQGATAIGYFRVFPGEPIPWQFWPDAVTPVRIVDSIGHPIEDATIDVVSVHNAGMQAQSDQFGNATLHAVVCGPMTARANKAGDSTSTESWFMCKTASRRSLLDRCSRCRRDSPHRAGVLLTADPRLTRRR